MGPVLKSIDGFCVQTDEDGRRFESLGIAPERIEVTGNCKFDLEIEALSEEEKAAWREELGIASGRPIVVAGSTHRGEEEQILDALEKVKEEVEGVCLILAPRHPERFDEATELARGRGFSVRRATDAPGANSGEPDVVVLDKMGVLARAYGLGSVAIVAGSFGPVGGHNLLEAAAHAIPVVYGPNMRSQPELARLFEAAGAGTQVGAEGLADALKRLLGNEELRRKEGERALGVLRSNQGSARRCAEAMRRWLK